MYVCHKMSTKTAHPFVILRNFSKKNIFFKKKNYSKFFEIEYENEEKYFYCSIVLLFHGQRPKNLNLRNFANFFFSNVRTKSENWQCMAKLQANFFWVMNIFSCGEQLYKSYFPCVCLSVCLCVCLSVTFSKCPPKMSTKNPILRNFSKKNIYFQKIFFSKFFDLDFKK